ncbi:DUF3558 domain-containing protein [Rhodococcus rhodnii]|uniref:DUF3558 domain-containing protein n=2 Tax=Rhodococcus rhodnii TaxID=38312 RepID=R7WGP4_9NOCA|nr:DUF3558 domain-containing protein [Rhodococcus rhodnii]EOM74225.1 hypothetical protein Rrhod_4368 [Rhodococcus rhodnii LMG 5362]TXG89619.1 DUF3558 domain-containing protein [Rhodococcus rhodnii]
MSANSLRVPLIAAALLLAVSCASENAGGADSPSSSNEADSSSPALPPRHIDESERPQVTFDPCRDLTDEAISAIGYDPATEDGADTLGESQTFLGCSWKTDPRRYHLTVTAGNVTLDEHRARNSGYATESSLAGVPALMMLDPRVPDSCVAALPSDFGAVLLLRTDRDLGSPASPTTPDQRCEGIEQTAAAVVDAMNPAK